MEKLKCKKDNVELVGYCSKNYPYERGYECPICHRQWSDLQIARAINWGDEKLRKTIGSDGVVLDKD